MKIGVSFPQAEAGSDVGFLRDFVQTAEALGYAYITVPEHIVQAGQPEGTSSLVPANHYSINASFHEVMTTLAYWAALTERIELVASVLVTPQRNAVLVAKQAAQIDLVCGGRFRLGIGVGWNAAEFSAMGADFQNRGKRIVEQVEVMRRLWCEHLVTFKGEWHSIDNMGLNPSSIQKPIPIWMGAMNPVAIRRAARMADGWFMNPRQGPNDDAARQISIFRQTAAEAGREPDDLGIDATVFISEGDGPEEWLGVMETWSGMGVDNFTFRTSESGLTDYDQHLAAIRQLKEHME
jgi:probable F420-dependent oxidoreductase